MNTSYLSFVRRSAIGVAALALLTACGVSKTTEDAVARAASRVQQTQQALGNSEGGALDLQRARDHLQQAKQAVENGDDEPAQRHAQRAELDAELAVAKTRNAEARRAADELQASLQTLKKEAQRSLGTTR